MTMAAQTLVDRFTKFTNKSLDWCVEESENATSQVSQAIDTLLQTTSRVSELSEDSLTAINDLKHKLQNHIAKKGSSEDLISSLQDISSRYDEIQNVIHPIIETLQFQDRLRQNLENLSKMIPLWIESRQRYAQSISQEDLLEFGESLMACTTMKDERDCIRKYIKGLKEEQQQDSVTMF